MRMQTWSSSYSARRVGYDTTADKEQKWTAAELEHNDVVERDVTKSIPI